METYFDQIFERRCILFFFNVYECLFVCMYSYLLHHVRRGQKRELIPQIGKLIKKEGHYDCVLETKIKDYIW